MRRVERIKQVEKLAAEMLPEFFKNRHNYGMGTSSLKDMVPMAVDTARAIMRESRRS